jgi:hypothetical protein
MYVFFISFPIQFYNRLNQNKSEEKKIVPTLASTFACSKKVGLIYRWVGAGARAVGAASKVLPGGATE